MKKSIWGYSVKEVNSTFEMLSNQNATLIQHNDYMEDEIRNLVAQLDEAKANVAVGMTRADADAYKELKIAYSALQQRLIQYTKELEEEKMRVNALNEQLKLNSEGSGAEINSEAFIELKKAFEKAVDAELQKRLP